MRKADEILLRLKRIEEHLGIKAILNGMDRFPMVGEVMKACEAEYELPHGSLRIKTKARQVCDARFQAYHFIKRLYPKITLKVMGKAFGQDHSTIINGLQQFGALIKNNADFRRHYTGIQQRLNIN